MNNAKLHDALHEVAARGVGADVDVQLARMTTGARAGGRRQARRQWFGVAGVAAATAVVVLLVAGLFVVTRPPEVVPASGAGSLPDRIFPTRGHILTLEQAPIGRVSMVYAGATANGGPAWIAVGADSDEYRWVAAASNHSRFNANLDVSPDGSLIAIGRGGDRSGDLGVDILNASSGTSSWIALPDDGAGGRIESLRWDTSGDRVGVQASVTNGDDPDGSSARTKSFVVTVSDGSVDPLPWQGQMVGWSGDEPVTLLSRAPTTLSEPGIRRHDLVTVGSLQVVGRVDQPPTAIGSLSLSPDGRLFAGLEDPTPSSSGDGKPWRLQVHDARSGEVVWQIRDVPEDLSAVVGWRDARTPVLYTADPGADGKAAPLVQVAEYPRVAGAGVRLVGLDDVGESVWVSEVRLAQDVLASGEVRVAEPPHQPWYDPRTLGPTVTGWFGDNAAAAVLLALLVGVVLVAVVLRVASGRRSST